MKGSVINLDSPLSKIIINMANQWINVDRTNQSRILFSDKERNIISCPKNKAYILHRYIISIHVHAGLYPDANPLAPTSFATMCLSMKARATTEEIYFGKILLKEPNIRYFLHYPVSTFDA